MNTDQRMKQMAHLRQKQISDSSCKAIIIDTIFETAHPFTQAELASEISSLFHILVSPERLSMAIQELNEDNTVYYDDEDHIRINPLRESEFMVARLQETELRKKATYLWLEHIKETQAISAELSKQLSQALPIFLRSIFVRHGVLSYELLTSAEDVASFDLKQIAESVSKQFEKTYQADISRLLPSIFQVLHLSEVLEYLKHGIEKAVGYISEVISNENMAQITSALRELVVYLDTNTIYRLLNLQGTPRYEAIKETLDFCRNNGVKLRISAETKKELSARLSYDAKVLKQFPTQANLAQAGYKYRATDNYVSTYWLQAKTVKVSVNDFIEYYQNFDILLEAQQIEIEDVVVDEQPLMDRAKYLYGKMSLRDPEHEKNEKSLWHDAYNFAYVQKMQKADAKNAIDTHCLFLTTDQALTKFQREDFEVKTMAPVVIAPSQLLQMFAFSTADSGYEETFIKFFASSSLGVSFKYNNNDIQEIISRIGHYKGVDAEIAEKILSRELVRSRYLGATTDEEKEEIIYNSVSEELLNELKLTKEQVTTLEKQKDGLDNDCKAAIDLLDENENRYEEEKRRLREENDEANSRLNAETTARKREEENRRSAEKKSEMQEEFYVNEKLGIWERNHKLMFWCGLSISFLIVVAAILLWLYFHDSGYFGVLGALTLTIFPTTFGATVFSKEKIQKVRQSILEDYRIKLKKIR